MKLINADCIEAMKEMPDNIIDSIVTDPPYELGFMGKSWDSTGIAYQINMWQEALRVLKPGGHLLAFSGSRTYHRMVVAIEDAGFEIRDQIMWLYGSGFPKSLNIDKAIDKTLGVERKILGISRMQPDIRGNNYAQGQREYGGDTVPQYITEPATDLAKKWQGWGTALKPAHEPIVVARKPLIGTVVENVLTHGTGGINIDATRVGLNGGTFKASKPEGISNGIYGEGINGTVDIGELNKGRWPANVIHDGSDEVVELFPNNGSPARFFYSAKTSKRDRNEGLEDFAIKEVHRYGAGVGEGLTPNAPSLDRNFHPTVKPTELMRYLCKLITPPNGTVLDPFMGSGSTGKAAVLEGFDFIGIEQDAEYIKIAEARITYALNTKDELLF